MFPNLNLTIPPSQGSAVVWFSSTSSLATRGPDQTVGSVQDERTLHVGCPIAAGNKWAALKIAFKTPQWNRVRCGTDRDGEIPPPGN